MRIGGAIALVTGASSGIGAATAARLAAAGAHVLVHGRDAGRVREIAERTGGTPLVADLAAPGAGKKLAEAAGRVDILVNNAGLGWAGPAEEMTGHELAGLVAVNLTAPMELTTALLPQFKARGSGSLVFVSSIAARLGVAGESVYAGTKAGLDVFAESLRLELTGTGLHVGVLVPGVVQTSFFERRNRPYSRRRPRPLPVDVAADALLELVKNGHAERHAPRWLRVPIAVRGTVPGVYRRLGARFGG